MDRFGLDHLLPTATRVEVVAQLCAEGYARQMVLSHDATCWTDMQSEEYIAQMLVHNPRAIVEARHDGEA